MFASVFVSFLPHNIILLIFENSKRNERKNENYVKKFDSRAACVV